MIATPTLMIMAIVALLGSLGVVIVDSIVAAFSVALAVLSPTQGCRNTIAFNTS
jgi:hypothetical protein